MNKKRLYIGLNDNYHDPSITILNDEGGVLYSESIERIIQYKRGLGCPSDPDVLINYVIEDWAQYNGEEVVIATAWKKLRYTRSKLGAFIGLLNYDNDSWFYKLFKRMGANQTFYHSSGRFVAAISQSGYGINDYLKFNFPEAIVHRKFYDHHLAHMVNGIHSTNEKNGVGLVIDAAERWVSVYNIENGYPGKALKINTKFSMGSIYFLLTSIIGYSYLKGEEWKVMGLSAYGSHNELFDKKLRELFGYENGNFKSSSAAIGQLVEPIKNFITSNNISHEDVAFTGQALFEEYLLVLVGKAKKLVPNKTNIIISGGSALNSLAIGRLAEKKWFKNVIVPNACGDDGNSLGAALIAFREFNPKAKFPSDGLNRNPYSGGEINSDELQKFVENSQLPFKKFDNIAKVGAELLYANKIIGWIQGRSEFGSRALGNRSILANPCYKENKERINAVVKFREGFRPFAPSILHEFGDIYLQDYSITPYMEKALTFREEVMESIPAVVHKDGTGRLQSVMKEMNSLYYELISEFNNLSGIPIVVNTSYNVMGKPIANDINDVISLFFNSEIDALIIGDYLLERESF